MASISVITGNWALEVLEWAAENTHNKKFILKTINTFYHILIVWLSMDMSAHIFGTVMFILML